MCLCHKRCCHRVCRRYPSIDQVYYPRGLHMFKTLVPNVHVILVVLRPHQILMLVHPRLTHILNVGLRRIS